MKALITGITGQDGAYLAKFLLDKGYEVYGTYRRISTPNFWRLQYLDIFEKVNLIPADLVDASSMVEAIKIAEPDGIYHLAAQSFVGTSFEQPIGTGEVTGLGVTRVLEAVRQINPEIKFYQASTSELYGRGHSSSLNENSPFQPASPYAAAKLYGYWLTKEYEEGYNVHTYNGVFIIRESPVREIEHLKRKIYDTFAEIAFEIKKELYVGNLTPKSDLKYAFDYGEPTCLMRRQNESDNSVIATNGAYSVKKFVEKTFEVAGLDLLERQRK